MFEALGQKLGDIFDRLKRRGPLSEADVDVALREIRIALLEADVALPVVKDFIAEVKAQAIGQDIIKSVTPGQMVVKIVHDALIQTLGAENASLSFASKPPAVLMMVGLQGSGKTTTTAKVARHLHLKQGKKILMASTDVYRPAAREQLATLGRQAEVATLPIIQDEAPLSIAKRAFETARLEGYDVLMLDTAGRLHIDDALMQELSELKTLLKPTEILLVADAMTGQDAVTVAKTFQDQIGVTGIVLTRVDGDARGGAALSMRAATGAPIKFLGLGERIEQIEVFTPERIAARILDMGDIVGLVEKAMDTIDQDDAERMAKKMRKGDFDLNDLAAQIQQMNKMGGIDGLLGMLPGAGKIKAQVAQAGVDPSMLKRQLAVISSMTQKERRDVKLLNASRRRRIAAGSGTSVADVNRLIKQFQDMRDMMKRMNSLGEKGLKRGGFGKLFGR